MEHRAAATLKYILMFTAVYAALAVAVAILAELTGFEANSGVSAGMFIAAVVLPAYGFAKDHGRVPSKGERARFALGSLIVSLAAGVALLAAAGMIEGDQGAPANLLEMLAALFEAYGLILVFGLVAISAIYFAVAYFSFRWFAKTALKANQKKSAT